MICLRCGDRCTRFEIPEIGKPARERCPNLSSDNRCEIYQTRPKICRDHDYPFAVCPIGKENNTQTPTGKCWHCGAILFEAGSFCCNSCRVAYAKSCERRNPLGKGLFDIDIFVNQIETQTGREARKAREYGHAVGELLEIEVAANNKAQEEVERLREQTAADNDTICQKYDMIVELNERIDAYIDLVRRMAPLLSEWSSGHYHIPTIDILAEAEAMTKG